MTIDRSALIAMMRTGDIDAERAGELSAAIEQDLRSRLPKSDLRLRAAVDGPVEIARDRLGIPHIRATTSPDLYFGLGFALAQDRLWQMDMLRRRGQGRLSEVLGETSLSSDIAHRTIGLDRQAEADASAVSETTAAVVAAFVAGVNRSIETSAGNLPIEFDLLSYEPDPWRIADVYAAIRGFWWQLNGRLFSIIAGEAGLRWLPEGPLRDAFMTPEFNNQTILPSDDAGQHGGHTGSDDGKTGSNNWAVAGSRTQSGAGVLGSDPHLPFTLPSTWYECRLTGPEDDAAGAIFAAAPGLFFGRNQHLAWGITNNNTSLRDLYIEETDPENPETYREGSDWVPFTVSTVDIPVRDRAPESLTIRETRRGPLVNHLVTQLDPAGDPPVSLRWVGQQPIDNISCLIAANRARDWQEFRASLKTWVTPTFNWVVAGTDGSVGYQCSASIPVRGQSTRGLRRANEPLDAWTGYVDYDAMPRIDAPASGFVDSANNRTASPDFPIPMYGQFASGDRATRIRQVLTDASGFDGAACEALQHDTFAPYAERLVSLVIEQLGDVSDPEIGDFVACLSGWDYHYDLDSGEPVLFESFRKRWVDRVFAERFPAHITGAVAGQGSVATKVLEVPELGWFTGPIEPALRECAVAALRDVRERYGDDPAGWRWGDVHLAHFRHPLSNAFTAAHFDVGPAGVSGSVFTVRNTGLGGTFTATSGAELLFVADLSSDAVQVCQNMGQSGQPGSPHYQDQFASWIAETYHDIPFGSELPEADRAGYVHLTPAE
ncbi:MAG: penicillin acylase family protein [Thermomicrobiales bacterium]|nr:penicillin acylase family protein [Thermomicrobiales bacterium]